MITEKIRIYPDDTQKILIDKILYECKEFYNYLLECHMDAYSFGISCKRFDYEKFWKVYPGPKAHLSTEIRQNVEFRLSDAFVKFFSKKSKNSTPRYKSIRKYRSFTYVNYKHGFNIGDEYVRGSIVGKIKAKFTRKIVGIPKTLTIKKLKTGEYYAFLQLDNIYCPKEKFDPNRKFAVGVDIGMKKFAQLSDGLYISRPWFITDHYNRTRETMTRRELFKKVQGSKNWEKARVKYTKYCQKVKNQRIDHHFKVAHYLTHNYIFIVCEDLNIHDMKCGKQLSKEGRAKIDLYGFYEFLEILKHMCRKYSSILIKVDARNTTQECCSCGSTVHKTLQTRVHICPVCGLTVDRDLNAARVILQRGVGGRSTVGTTGSIKLVELCIPGL